VKGKDSLQGRFVENSYKTISEVQNLVGVQDVRWDRVTLNEQAIVHLSMEMGMRIMN
jgi:hypothetical protein